MIMKHGTANPARATRLEQEAQLQGFRGRNAQQAGFIRAGTTILSGAARGFSFGGGTGANLDRLEDIDRL